MTGIQFSKTILTYINLLSLFKGMNSKACNQSLGQCRNMFDKYNLIWSNYHLNLYYLPNTPSIGFRGFWEIPLCVLFAFVYAFEEVWTGKKITMLITESQCEQILDIDDHFSLFSFDRYLNINWYYFRILNERTRRGGIHLSLYYFL